MVQCCSLNLWSLLQSLHHICAARHKQPRQTELPARRPSGHLPWQPRGPGDSSHREIGGCSTCQSNCQSGVPGGEEHCPWWVTLLATSCYFTNAVGVQRGGLQFEIWAECQNQNMNKKQSLSHTLVNYLCSEMFLWRCIQANTGNTVWLKCVFKCDCEARFFLNMVCVLNQTYLVLLYFLFLISVSHTRVDHLHG